MAEEQTTAGGDDELTEMREQDSEGPPAGYNPRARRLSIVITQRKVDEHGVVRSTSHTVPLLGKSGASEPAPQSRPCPAARFPEQPRFPLRPGLQRRT